jgi:hypothetical protein
MKSPYYPSIFFFLFLFSSIFLFVFLLFFSFSFFPYLHCTLPYGLIHSVIPHSPCIPRVAPAGCGAAAARAAGGGRRGDEGRQAEREERRKARQLRPRGHGCCKRGGAPMVSDIKERRRVCAGVVGGGRRPHRGPRRSVHAPSASAILRLSGRDTRIDGRRWEAPLDSMGAGCLRQAPPRRPPPSLSR